MSYVRGSTHTALLDIVESTSGLLLLVTFYQLQNYTTMLLLFLFFPFIFTVTILLILLTTSLYFSCGTAAQDILPWLIPTLSKFLMQE